MGTLHYTCIQLRSTCSDFEKKGWFTISSIFKFNIFFIASDVKKCILEDL